MQAQTYEVGVLAGGMNMIGDVGEGSYIKPNDIAFGAIAKWNRSSRYAWRASVLYGSFTADDALSNMTSRQQRGYRIQNNIFEASAGLEVNFVSYNLHRLGPAFTPYMYTGVTYARYDYNYFNAGQFVNNDQRDGTMAVPMILGFKVRLNQFLILGAEIGARYTFTDNLDASNPEGSNFESFRFGNIFSDDWYVFSGMSLTYTFKRKPCSDCFD